MLRHPDLRGSLTQTQLKCDHHQSGLPNQMQEKTVAGVSIAARSC